MADWKVVFELAKRMGYEEYFPWRNVEELIDYYMEPTGLTARQLMEENPCGVYSGLVEDEEYWRQHPGQPRFPTPSGKVELYCETLSAAGYDPLVTYIEPAESPVSDPELARKYPLILTTGARVNEYWHGCFQGIKKLRQRVPEPLAEIHPKSAAECGVSDGDIAVLETKRGSIEIKVKASEDIMPGVVNIPHGWVKGNANILTDDALQCRESGYPNMHALLCRIRKSA